MFGFQKFISHKYVLGKTEHSSSRNSSHSVSPKQNCDFLENDHYNFDDIFAIYEDHILEENCISGTFREFTLHALAAQK
jgi:hypothetical protein